MRRAMGATQARHLRRFSSRRAGDHAVRRHRRHSRGMGADQDGPVHSVGAGRRAAAHLARHGGDSGGPADNRRTRRGGGPRSPRRRRVSGRSPARGLVDSRLGDGLSRTRDRFMIQTEGLSREYADKIALSDLNLRVEPGEILGFLGPNGAGKSTTVKILTGMIRPTRGRAVVAGFDVVEQPLEAKKRLGYVPETAALYDSLTAAGTLRANRVSAPPGSKDRGHETRRAARSFRTCRRPGPAAQRVLQGHAAEGAHHRGAHPPA